MPTREEALAHLARILESREFRAARNRARFLEFVVTRTLEGAEDGLKEYTIGVEVFDRGAAFDPRTDGVVRTQAGLVRKHLERYYATEGRDEPFEIDLPKGHYIPQVKRRTPAASMAPGDGPWADRVDRLHASGGSDAAGTAAMAEGRPPETDDGVDSGARNDRGGARASGVAAASATDDAAFLASRRRTGPRVGTGLPIGTWLRPASMVAAALAIIAVAVIASGASGRYLGLGWERSGARTGAGQHAVDAAKDGTAGTGAEGAAGAAAVADAEVLSTIWGPFFARGASNVLAFGIPQFFTGGGGLWVRDVAVNSATTTPDTPGLTAMRRQFGALQPAEAYTGIGEAYGVYLVSRLFMSRSHELRVMRSPTLSWDNLKHDNVIFLTSARFKTLAAQLSFPAEFQHVLGRPNRVANLHPAPGEQTEYIAHESHGTTSVDHAIVSMVPGKLPGRRVLILSGGGTWGTQAAAEYVTEPGYLRELNQRLRACREQHGLARHPEFFQVLLRVEVRDSQPLGARYVTHHDLHITETGEPLTMPPVATAQRR